MMIGRTVRASTGAAMNSLAEQYRPRTWSEVVGQDKTIHRINLLRNRGLAGRAYWVSGASGTGKTTIARLIAGEIADEWGIEELDSSELTPAALRDAERSAQSKTIDGNGRVYIVNEAHGLRKDSIRQLLVILERIPGHVAWIFTTTNAGTESVEQLDDAAPLLSRCTRLDLSRRDLARPFAERLREIAIREGLSDRPIEKFQRLVSDWKNNFRAALQAVEGGWGCNGDE